MVYKFYCSCGHEVDINIPIERYDQEKNKQKCEKCGKTLKRKIEFAGSIGSTGGYDSIGGKAAWQS